jgi:hypothetical protein
MPLTYLLSSIDNLESCQLAMASDPTVSSSASSAMFECPVVSWLEVGHLGSWAPSNLRGFSQSLISTAAARTAGSHRHGLKERRKDQLIAQFPPIIPQLGFLARSIDLERVIFFGCTFPCFNGLGVVARGDPCLYPGPTDKRMPELPPSSPS